MSQELDQAWANARKFCADNPGWKTINQIPNESLLNLYLGWDELPAWERKLWIRKYGKENGKDAWEALGNKRLRIEYSFVGHDGVHYGDVRVMPPGTNFVMVLNMGQIKNA